MKKHIAQSFEFNFSAQSFNLAGEVAKTPAPNAPVKEDKTPEMFAPEFGDDGQYNFQHRKTLVAGFVFAKNSNAAKYRAAKKNGGKPSDYWVEADAEDTRRFRAALALPGLQHH